MLIIKNLLLSVSIAILLLSGCDNTKIQEPEEQAKEQAKEQPASQPIVKEKIKIAENMIAQSCQLTMGWEPWEPYHYEDIDKQVKGLDIELMEMITAETGCEINFKKGDWKVLLHELKLGEIDLLTGASITEKRKEYAMFSDGYRTESFRLYVRAGEAEKFSSHNMKTLIDNGFRLGVTMDYIYNDEVNSLQDDPTYADKIIAVSTGLINLSKLYDGVIDGFLEDSVVGSSSIHRQGLEEQIDVHPYVINSGDVHVMFSQTSVDEATINSFNLALAKIKADGRHKLLIDKYTK